MCGIAGGLLPKPSSNEIDAVLQSMHHRGPDSNGIKNEEGEAVWLCAARLAIQDLSSAGNQPLSTPDGRYTIVFNGEIYNHWELRKTLELKGCSFSSGADTETLLYAFVNWGEACLERLSGIFAFAVWDNVRQRLFIARDGMGVKPLYYYWDGRRFAFASELKSLLPITGLDLTLAPDAFYNYLLLLYNPEAQTPFRNILKLAPGHYLRMPPDTPPVQVRWHRLSFTEDKRRPEGECIQELEDRLLSAVRDQMRSDAPLGFLLSGGLDSSLIVAMAQKINGCGYSPRCFTLDTGAGMAGEGFGDDARFAKGLATQLSIRTQLVDNTDVSILQELDRTIWHLDEPQADPAAMQVGAIAGAARAQGIKVLLSGTGADDIFSGYRRHQVLVLKTRLSSIPSVIKSFGLFAGKTFGNDAMKRRIAKLGASGAISGDDYFTLFFWTKEAEAAALFENDMQDATACTRSFLKHIPDEANGPMSSLNEALCLEQRAFLPHHNLNYLDKMMMASGIEGRVPYLDDGMVSFANSLPGNMKMRGMKTKYALRKVAEKYLPREIIYRPKTGFGAPLRSFMTGSNIELARERLLDKSFGDRNIFSPAAIEDLLRSTAAGKRDGAYTILSLLSIESWLRQFAITHSTQT